MPGSTVWLTLEHAWLLVSRVSAKFLAKGLRHVHRGKPLHGNLSQLHDALLTSTKPHFPF